MRLHLPVRPREHAFPQGLASVSTTDLKSHILPCHPDSIELSGYAQEALLGQAHQLIRRPDMTEERFRDLGAEKRVGPFGHGLQRGQVLRQHAGSKQTAALRWVTMSAVSNSSHRMDEIRQVIKGHAFQANFLALNAAVESARGDEHGQDFAAVASEVRALAQRRSKAEPEIKPLITESADTVSAGERQTRKSQESIDEKQKSIQDFGRQIADMPLSACEQLSGVSQVNQAIKEMETITQQNAAMVKEVQASLQIFRLSQKGRMERLPDARTLRRLAKAQRNAP